MSFYTALLRPLAFALPAETAHHLTVEACRVAGFIPGVPQLARACFEFEAPELETDVAGLHFANPIGLAAGWDKSGRALRMLGAPGFGFAEIGSVSARPSSGNPKPRLFRLPEERAIIVNYGLPNEGAEVVARRLASRRVSVPLGVNIVKTNDGPDAPACTVDEILADYERSVSLLHPRASYLALNLSCPNAGDGRDFFATAGNITRLLERLSPIRIGCPVILKVSPDPASASIERIIAEAAPFPFVRGFSFNLPHGKPDTLRFRTPREHFAHRPGAVAGRPVAGLINSCISELHRRMPRGRFVIIGAGGVFTAADAYEKIRRGASLVQLYTAMVYEGPGVVRRIQRGLCALLKRDGFQNVGQAVGAGPPL